MWGIVFNFNVDSVFLGGRGIVHILKFILLSLCRTPGDPSPTLPTAAHHLPGFLSLLSTLCRNDYLATN